MGAERWLAGPVPSPQNYQKHKQIKLVGGGLAPPAMHQYIAPLLKWAYCLLSRQYRTVMRHSGFHRCSTHSAMIILPAA